MEWHICLLAFLALAFIDYTTTLAATAFLAASIVCALLSPSRALSSVLSGLVPWLYLILAGLSVIWSSAPDLSTRYAIELALTTGAALVIAGALTPGAFLAALMCALLVSGAASVASGQMQMNYGQLALVGVFGSKNSFSLAQAVCVMSCWWVVLSRSQRFVMRTLALFGLLASVALLMAGRSAGAMAAVAAGLSISVVAYNLSWFSHRLRVIMLVAATFVIALTFVLLSLVAEDLFEQALSFTGKDVTLSGRTYLWATAGKLIGENPIFGYGFSAFWVQGNPYAENIWSLFAPGKTGFHFHNLWYEVGVELAFPGLILAAITMAITTLEVLRWVVRSGATESCFFLGFVMFVDIRSVLEVDIFSQFSCVWVTYVAAWAYARNSRRALVADAGQRRSGGLSPAPSQYLQRS
jgi:exopolysaccharide production protein ExoQ